MSSGGVEEVGLRLLIEGGATFRDELSTATDAVTRFTDATDRMAAVERRAGKAVADSQAVMATSLEDADLALQTSTDRMAAWNAEQARAAEVSKAGAASIARSQKVMAGAVAESSAVASKSGGAIAGAVAASTKILKWGAMGVTAIAYEGIKNWNTFQQQIAQSAIDAGVNKSQMPAFEAMAMRVSNATGLAAASVGDMMYRIASANPQIHMTTKAMGAMANAAGQLYVLAGATGNADSIGRIYGAITSNRLSLNGGAALNYSAAGAKAINEWALAVTGHGDMKMGDLVAAMGTGLLPVAGTFGLSLNQVGAALDVLSPAMNASSASTRLKTALSMLAAPSQKAAQGYELFGGNIATAASIMRSKGLGSFLGYMNKMFSHKVTGATFASAFYGGGLGSITGGTKGIGSGAGEYLRVLGLTPAQASVMESKGAVGFLHMNAKQLSAAGFSPGTTGRQAMLSIETALLSGMFGGGHTGAAIMQLMLEQSTYQNKLRAIHGAETPTAYEKALKIAYKEPIVAFHRFEQQLRNLTIVVGRDITPAFDGFLSDLEAIGRWFGANKNALRDLGLLAGGVFGGAALIKLASGAATIVHGGTSIVKAILNPGAALKGIFTGKAGLTGSASALTRSAVSLDESAAALKGAAEVVRPGGVSTPNPGTAEETVAAEGATGLLARGKAALGVATKAASVLGLAVTAGDAVGTAIAHTTWGKNLGLHGPGYHQPGWQKPIHSAGERMLNVADTIGNIMTGGLWHPHLQNAAETSTAYDMAHYWGINLSKLSRPQQQTLLNYWNGGEKHLNAAQRNVVAAVGTGSLTAAQQHSMRGLASLAKEVEALANEHDTHAQKETQAASDQKEAAQLLKQAAQLFVNIPPQLAAALSASNIHAAANAGLQHKAARH